LVLQDQVGGRMPQADMGKMSAWGDKLFMKREEANLFQFYWVHLPWFQ
jgi:hypothetical protein